MSEAKHQIEEVVDAVVEQFWADVDIIVEYLKTEGRPIFHHRLTDAEQIARFLDSTLNPVVSQDVLTKLGADALLSYQTSLRRRLERKANERLP